MVLLCHNGCRYRWLGVPSSALMQGLEEQPQQRRVILNGVRCNLSKKLARRRVREKGDQRRSPLRRRQRSINLETLSFTSDLKDIFAEIHGKRRQLPMSFKNKPTTSNNSSLTSS